MSLTNTARINGDRRIESPARGVFEAKPCPSETVRGHFGCKSVEDWAARFRIRADPKLILAERVRFAKPAIPRGYTGFRDRRFRSLSRLSLPAFYI